MFRSLVVAALAAVGLMLFGAPSLAQPQTASAACSLSAQAPWTLTVQSGQICTVDVVRVTMTSRAQITSGPRNGTASLSGLMLTYQPNPNHRGDDMISISHPPSVRGQMGTQQELIRVEVR
jgi:hypothetical protein